MSELIYVLDDEENILEIVSYNLEKSGYKVESFRNSKDFLCSFDRRKPDLVILDLMLPDVDGFDICKEIKNKTEVPVIILSARGEELDKVLGLELGADDYIVKPFGVRELTARVKNVLRRIKGNVLDGNNKLLKNEFEFGEIKLFIDEKKHDFLLDGEFIRLNPKEFKLITILLRNLNNLSTRQELIKKVWGEDYFGDTRTLDVHIRRIREKLSYKNFGEKFIKTVHGYGYKMVDKT